jgi:hypothetical protein
VIKINVEPKRLNEASVLPRAIPFKPPQTRLSKKTLPRKRNNHCESDSEESSVVVSSEDE